MRSAPPVLVPVGRFVWGPRWACLLAFASLVLCEVALATQGLGVQAQLLTGAVWLLACMTAGWFWWRERLLPGELAWDGQAWHYRVPGRSERAAQLELLWDAGAAMLLRLRLAAPGPVKVHHLWLQADCMPQAWHNLRCAVHVGDTL